MAIAVRESGIDPATRQREVRVPRPPVPWDAVAAGLVMALGIALRVHEFMVRRSLWFDEAAVSLNVVERSFGGLGRPLAGNQGAPLGYLYVSKLSVLLLGPNEYGVRLPALVGGLAALPLVYFLARRIVGRYGAVVALALVAFSGQLVAFSDEAKQYSSDVAVAAVLPLLALWARESGWTRRRTAAFAVAGAAAVWFSHPAIFVLAGIGIVCLVEQIRARHWPAAGNLLAAGVLWVASFGIDYAVSLSKLDANQSLRNYWSASFMPFPPKSVEDVKWYYHAFAGVLQQLSGVRLDVPLAVALLAGIVLLRRRQPVALAVALVPALLALAASALKAYPFGDRAVLFLTPATAVVAAAFVTAPLTAPVTMTGARDRSRARPGRGVLAVAVGVLVAVPLVPTLKDQTTVRREELRQVLTGVRRGVRPGDTVFVYQGAVPAFDFYTRKAGLRGVRVVEEPATCDVGALVSDVIGLPPGQRAWLVYSHLRANGTTDHRALQTSAVARQRPLLSSIQHYGAVAYLFGQDAPAPPASIAIAAPHAPPAAECI